MDQDKNRNYVAAWFDWNADKVIVLERDQTGALFKKRYNPPYYFYVPDEEGTYESIYGDKLLRAEFGSREEYEAAKRAFPKRFESDIRPLQRVLMDIYYDRPAPPVYYAFLDIEVNYAQSIGFAGPTNPYADINAVTVYQSWTGKFLTYVLPPLVQNPAGEGKILWTEIPGNNVDRLNAEIKALVAKKLLREGFTPEITICKSETELLMFMLEAIQPADIISGWNSEFYDIPYIAERLILLGGEHMLGKLEHIGVRGPKKEMINRFGSEEPIYKFSGRSHLDYMKLFQKFTFEGRVSYSLGNILQEEVGVGKLDYDGTLEQLYHNDFPTFVAYNFRDVDGLVQLDAKFKFIALSNQMAHENTVLFDAVLGTVSYVETGITNHAHYKLNQIVNDKSISDHDKVEGAVVINPWRGLHKWLGSVDLKSLYPNTIRSLNISPEKIVGQFSQPDLVDDSTAGEKDWDNIRNETDVRIDFYPENGEPVIMTGKEWKEVLKEQKWAVSAYGTVFDQSGSRGVIADILAYWYNERKRLQAEKKKWAKLAKSLPDGPEKDEALRQEEQYDLLQLTKKISMNSLYGALLNKAFRFGDQRLGASVTASGRQITTHMVQNIGEFLTGVEHRLDKRYTTSSMLTVDNSADDDVSQDYAQDAWFKLPKSGAGAVYRPIMKDASSPHGWTFSDVIIYGDTDSCYYICKGATNKEEAIEIADLAASTVNASFPDFMRSAFNCQPEFDLLIEAGREVVGVRGLFQAKKKYMVKVVDLEGFAVDKLKTQGSEIKKADTPKIIQKFLKSTVDMILDGADYDSIATHVNGQRKAILKNKDNVFLLGVAKQVNTLEKYMAEYLNPGTHRSASGGALTIPGHARAACNYNYLLDVFDRGAKAIKSGDKVLVYYVKPNEYKFKAIALPAELSRFPKWFEEHFSVDIKLTEQKMFDNKLAGVFDAMGQDVPSLQSVLTNSILSF